MQVALAVCATIITMIFAIAVAIVAIRYFTDEERGHCYVDKQALRMSDPGEDLLLVTDVKPDDAERFARLMNCTTFNGRQLPESIPPAP